ncbi:MAG: DUF3857 domain-containing protein [Candidatus Omnitrophica bacterium]|nr:DUF3857 domain-containing protein [Candidatus Omnitrophota bacterium]
MNTQKFYLFLTVCAVVLCGASCSSQQSIDTARKEAGKAQEFYRGAERTYRELISRGANADTLHFELGQLYYSHGQFSQAADEFKKTGSPAAKKMLAISYYRSGDYTGALDVFSQSALQDPEFLYYYGLTCEKLNLYDKALENYKKIVSSDFAERAHERVALIAKQHEAGNIRDLSPDVSALISSAPSAEQYPQAGALLLLSDEHVTVTPALTEETDLHYVVKILNERGKERYAEVQIEYDSTYEKVELEFARTIKVDGNVTYVGTRHIRDVSKYLNFPLYSNARVYIISFPEIADGVTIEYKVKIRRNQLVNKKDFFLSYPVQSFDPILKANFSITIPKNKPLHIKTLNEKYNTFNASLSPRVEQQAVNTVYSWTFTDIPQIIPESNMPPLVEINPTFLVSTFERWEDIYDWWWPLAQNKIKADSQIQAKVSELTAGAVSDEAKIKALYNFCAQKIRYVAVEYGQAGYEPHQAEDIFKNKYGDCKDQAVLLVTMLKTAGLKAWPLLIATKDYYNLHEDFPVPLFNHCIAAVQLNNDIIFLDPTAETCPFGDLPPSDQDRNILVITEQGYKIYRTPLFPAAHNLINHEFVISVNSSEGIDAEKSIDTAGIYDQAERYWLLYTTPELVKQEIQERIQDISIGGKLKQYEVKNLQTLDHPIELNYSFAGPEYFIPAGALRILPQLAGVDSSLVAQETRRYPLYFGVLDKRQTQFTITIPPDYSVEYLPPGIREDNDWLNFSVDYSAERGTIVFKQGMILKKNRVSEEEYPAFKKIIEELAKRVKQRVVLIRKPG